jgi:hypothetical protein
MKVEKFKHIFSGLDRAHGEYRYSETKVNGKREGKMFTKHEAPTLQMYKDHLEGKMPALGIVPIRDDGTASWGCIDIDEYPLDHKKILSKIRELKLPLIMCSSKSFGAHLFLFSKKPQAANLFQQKLRECAAYLGYANSEVFPKQTQLANEKDTGSWLNLPYHGDTRYAFLDNGEGASLDDFFTLYDKFVCDDIATITIKIKQDTIKNGPPCLQFLTEKGYPEGTRNNGLFNIGIFYRKSNPDEWENLIEKYNLQYMDPPLNVSEVTTIQKQVRQNKADGSIKYTYRCNDQPILSVCQKPLCKTRKFGIGYSTEDHPKYSDLAVQSCVPPIWFMNVNDRRVEINQVGDLYNFNIFRNLASNQLKTYIPRMKINDWDGIVRVLFETINTIDVPEDVSKTGEFKDYLQEFCQVRGDSFTMDELGMGKAFTENGITYFRLADLSHWLDSSKNFKVPRPWIVQRLRDMDGKDVTVYPQKVQTRAWTIPEFKLPIKDVPLPPLKTEKKDTDKVLGGEDIDNEEIPF